MMIRRTSIFLVVSCLIAACGVNAAERNNAGNWFTQQGEPEPALDAYFAAQVAEPDHLVLYLNSAQALADAGEFEDAIDALELVIGRGNEELAQQAHYNLGNIYFDQFEFSEAISAYQAALLLKPDDSDARYNLELAQSFLLTPTPTAEEMKTSPDEEQVDTSATPTDQPINEPPPPPPTPTPTPPEGPTEPPGDDRGNLKSSDDVITTTPYENLVDAPETITPTPTSTLTFEEAEDILEPVAQDQKQLGDFTGTTATPGLPPSGKNW